MGAIGSVLVYWGQLIMDQMYKRDMYVEEIPVYKQNK